MSGHSHWATIRRKKGAADAKRGQVFTRLQLLNLTQGEAYEGYERTIDQHIKNLRKKIEPDPSSLRYIVTVHGVGYKFSAE